MLAIPASGRWRSVDPWTQWPAAPSVPSSGEISLDNTRVEKPEPCMKPCRNDFLKKEQNNNRETEKPQKPQGRLAQTTHLTFGCCLASRLLFLWRDTSHLRAMYHWCTTWSPGLLCEGDISQALSLRSFDFRKAKTKSYPFKSLYRVY